MPARKKVPALRRGREGRAVLDLDEAGQIMWVSINRTTTTNGTPSNQRMIGISASVRFDQLPDQ
jgi:hypothetical protein